MEKHRGGHAGRQQDMDAWMEKGWHGPWPLVAPTG
jgi:hypothetical protein